MQLKGHFDGSRWNVNYKPTQKDIKEFYDTLVDEDIYENDKDFQEYLEDKYQSEIEYVISKGYDDLNDYLDNKEDYE